jgi:hypothetical protein
MSDFSRLQELARAAGLQVNPPAMIDIPYVSPETAAVGDTLTSTMGNWNGEPTGYAYSWQHLDTNEVGTGSTYVVAATDSAHSLVCLVTATNGAGSTTATPSNAVVIPEAVASAARRTEHPPAHDVHSDARAEPGRRK